MTTMNARRWLTYAGGAVAATIVWATVYLNLARVATWATYSLIGLTPGTHLA